MKRDLPSPGSKSRRIDGRAFHQHKYVPVPQVTPADVLLDKAQALGEFPPEFFLAWYRLDSTEMKKT